MSWFEKLMPSRISTEKRTKSVPEGVWIKCTACDGQLYRNELERNLHVCPKCDFHMRIGARQRLRFSFHADLDRLRTVLLVTIQQVIESDREYSRECAQ